MDWLTHRLRGAYPDARLAWRARQAVAADPRLPDLTRLRITCSWGVIRLTRRVPQAQDRTRIEADIQAALQSAGIAYKRISNQLYVP